MNVAQRASLQRRPMPFPIVRQKFALVPRHVHAHRTLRFARSAFQAQIHHLKNTFIAQSGFFQPSGHSQAQNISPPACGIPLIPRRHIGRAHRPGELLPASTNSAAHLHRASHAPILRIVEKRTGPGCHVARAETQVRSNWRRIHNLPWIQNTQRIEGFLDFTKRFIQHIAKHHPHKRTPHQPVPVLAGKCAAKLQHQFRNVLRDRLKLQHALGSFQVDHRPHMQTAHRRVRVNSGRSPMAVNDGEEPFDVVAQLLRRHRRVFHKRDGLRVFLHRHRKTQRRLAQAPDLRLRRKIGFRVISVTEILRPQILLQRDQTRRQILLPVRIKFHTQRGARIARNKQIPDKIQPRILARIIQNRLVHHLNRGRRMRKDYRRGRQRLQQVRKRNHHHRFRLRQRHQPQLRLQHNTQRPFRPHHHL